MPGIEVKHSDTEVDSLAETLHFLEESYFLLDEPGFTKQKQQVLAMEGVLDKLKLHYKNSTSSIVEADKNYQAPRTASFIFFILFDLTVSSIGGFVGMIELLAMLVIPKIVAMVAAGFATAVEGTMMYAVFAPILKKALGVNAKPKETMVELYIKRLALMKEMNALAEDFGHASTCQLKEHALFVPILEQFNTDLAKEKLEDYHESRWKRAARYGLTGVSFMMSLTGSYMASKMLLMLIAASLLGTPAGWGLLIGLMVISLAIRYVVRGDAVYSPLNPEAVKHKKVKEDLEAFTVQSPRINHIHNYLSLKELQHPEAPCEVPHHPGLLCKPAAEIDAPHLLCYVRRGLFN